MLTTDWVRGFGRRFGIKKYKLNKKCSSINFEERFLLHKLFFAPGRRYEYKPEQK